MVRKTIRIYKFHDVDLFYLAEHYHFNFQKAIYCALREYLKKEVCVIGLPEKLEEPINIPKKSICRTLVLHEEKDRDLLEFMQKLPKGHVNGIIKNILRAYLCRPLMEPWADEYSQMFLKEKRVIQAADYTKKKAKAVKNRQTQKVKNSNSDEKHAFPEHENKGEPVMFFSKTETENRNASRGETVQKEIPFLTESKVSESISKEMDADSQVISNDMSEEDMLTCAFSSFFD
nr:hypothetical protein [uncultured Blautia sp.]